MKRYIDPLHIPSAKLQVRYNEYNIILNKALLDKQNAWGNLEKIKEAHLKKAKLYEALQNTEDRAKMKNLGKKLKTLEFKLQKLWGFPKDASFHRFWEYPKCECPRYDNMDAYPYRSYVNLGCPLHGD